MFLWDYSLVNSTWCSDIENILDDACCIDLYDEMHVCDIQEIEKELQKNLEISWLNDCNNKPKLRTYILFKEIYKAETYTKLFLSRRQRSLIAKLRAGILPLRIETGRYQNIKDTETGRFRKLHIEERLCQICNNDVVEDEIHFICNCPSYTDQRERLYREVTSKNELFNLMSDQEKFVYIMKNEVKVLSNYMCESWDIRNSKLYIG